MKALTNAIEIAHLRKQESDKNLASQQVISDFIASLVNQDKRVQIVRLTEQFGKKISARIVL